MKIKEFSVQIDESAGNRSARVMLEMPEGAVEITGTKNFVAEQLKDILAKKGAFTSALYSITNGVLPVEFEIALLPEIKLPKEYEIPKPENVIIGVDPAREGSEGTAFYIPLPINEDNFAETRRRVHNAILEVQENVLKIRSAEREELEKIAEFIIKNFLKDVAEPIAAGGSNKGVAANAILLLEELKQRRLSRFLPIGTPFAEEVTVGELSRGNVFAFAANYSGKDATLELLQVISTEEKGIVETRDLIRRDKAAQHWNNLEMPVQRLIFLDFQQFEPAREMFRRVPVEKTEISEGYSKEGLLQYFHQFLNGETGLANAEVLADLILLCEAETEGRIMKRENARFDRFQQLESNAGLLTKDLLFQFVSFLNTNEVLLIEPIDGQPLPSETIISASKIRELIQNFIAADQPATAPAAEEVLEYPVNYWKEAFEDNSKLASFVSQNFYGPENAHFAGDKVTEVCKTLLIELLNFRQARDQNCIISRTAARVLLAEGGEAKFGRADYRTWLDVITRIGEDEPVFIVRAQDVNAPELLQFYAKQNDNNDNGRIAALANLHKARFLVWQNTEGNGKLKMPDVDETAAGIVETNNVEIIGRAAAPEDFVEVDGVQIPREVFVWLDGLTAEELQRTKRAIDARFLEENFNISAEDAAEAVQTENGDKLPEQMNKIGKFIETYFAAWLSKEFPNGAPMDLVLIQLIRSLCESPYLLATPVSLAEVQKGDFFVLIESNSTKAKDLAVYYCVDDQKGIIRAGAVTGEKAGNAETFNLPAALDVLRLRISPAVDSTIATYPVYEETVLSAEMVEQLQSRAATAKTSSAFKSEVYLPRAESSPFDRQGGFDYALSFIEHLESSKYSVVRKEAERKLETGEIVFGLEFSKIINEFLDKKEEYARRRWAVIDSLSEAALDYQQLQSATGLNSTELSLTLNFLRNNVFAGWKIYHANNNKYYLLEIADNCPPEEVQIAAIENEEESAEEKAEGRAMAIQEGADLSGDQLRNMSHREFEEKTLGKDTRAPKETAAERGNVTSEDVARIKGEKRAQTAPNAENKQFEDDIKLVFYSIPSAGGLSFDQLEALTTIPADRLRRALEFLKVNVFNGVFVVETNLGFRTETEAARAERFEEKETPELSPAAKFIQERNAPLVEEENEKSE